jgi:uncharacterized membrane protein required for colicin V production
MNLPDLSIIAILLIFAVAGIRHGVIWELLTTVGLLLGFALTYYFRNELMDFVWRVSYPGWQRQWIGGLVFLASFMVVYIGFASMGHRLHEAVKKTPFRWVDYGLGLAGGVLKGAVVIGILVLVVDWADGAGRLRNFLLDSQIIRWGRDRVNGMMYWEPASKRKMVLEEVPESRPDQLTHRMIRST